MRRILWLLLVVWLVRWAAGELAAYAGRHWRRPGPSPFELARTRPDAGVPRTSDPKG